MPWRPPLHVFERPFYVKTAVASALLGAAMELFMIKTGFYDKCVVFAPGEWACEQLVATTLTELGSTDRLPLAE